MRSQRPRRPQPSPRLQGLTPYRVPRTSAPIDLYLDGNEGPQPRRSLMRALGRIAAERVRRYPDAGDLERALASRHGVRAEQVLVTAGGDDAIDRLCRATLAPGRALVAPTPTFQMLLTYASLAGATTRRVPWMSGPYPIADVVASAGADTSLVAVVSPNNPTGAVATARDLTRLSRSLPQATILVDLAYADFASEDLTATALALENTVTIRTFSKAMGLAGLRVGYAMGSPETIRWLRAAGAPYPVSSPSLELALTSLNDGESSRRSFVRLISRERETLIRRLAALGAEPLPSQANFVLCRFHNANSVRDGLAALSIAVRAFPGDDDLRESLRITCPGRPEDFRRLLGALEIVLAPDALPIGCAPRGLSRD